MDIYIVSNSTDEDITVKWDGKEYTLKKGETNYLPDYLAFHFGKYLAMREMKKAGHTVTSNPNNPVFKEFFSKFVSSSPIVSGSEDEVYKRLAEKGKVNIKGEPLFQCDVEGCDYSHPKESGIRMHKMRFHGIGIKEKNKKEENPEEAFEGLKKLEKEEGKE